VIALVVGTLIALLAVAFVLTPLFREEQTSPVRSARMTPEAGAGQEDAIGALREIEFDRETGKLSDSDYETLKARYTAEALETMRAADRATLDPAAADLAEEAILRYRRRVSSCAVCGPRPEPDAAYCSSCGRFLAGACGGCGAPVTEPAARFCTTCGRTLAA
jgi:hypothetical protein